MAVLETISSIGSEPKHPIRLVAHRTGLTVDLIRAWEKRYQVVDPARSDTKRRLYSDHDIERLRLIRIAKQAGRRLADIASLSLEELRDVVSEDTQYSDRLESAPVYPTGWNTEGVREAEQDLVDAMLYAVASMDQHAFDQLLQEGLVNQSIPVFLQQTLAPFLRELGEATRRGELRIAHEHLATAHLRTFLGAFRFRENFTGHEPKIVITTPTGQLHELGALMVAALVSVDGWQPLYLGPSTPADEIAACAKQAGAKAISLSLTYPADDPRIPTELTRLAQQLDGSVSVFVGGQALHPHLDLIERLGIEAPTSLDELRLALQELRAGRRTRNAV